MARSTRALVRATAARAGRFALSLLIATMGIALPAFTSPSPALAAPVLAVSVSASDKPLLGGRATFHVEVTNTGDAKAYNLSITELFGSSLSDPAGRIRVLAASDGSANLPPTSVTTSGATGDTTAYFGNIKDLAASETYEFDVVVDTSVDPSWTVGALLTDNVTVTGTMLPNGMGATITGSSSTQARIVPIKISSKKVEKSTGVEQATGTLDRTFTYAITVDNNFVGASQGVSVVDRVPDGVEYLGMSSGPAPTVSRDDETGVTTLTWSLGTMGAGATEVLRYRAGIRYDYFGTDNGGVNRAHDDFGPAVTLGDVVADKTTFTNTADLDATYAGQPATDTAQARVTGAYLTVGKSIGPSTGGNSTIVDYTLSAAASEYYDIYGAADGGHIVLHDRLPDGQTYVSGSASSVPDTITVNPDGTTDLYWDIAEIDHSTGTSLTFKASIDYLWEDGSLAGDDIVAGDSMVNNVDISGTYDDLVDDARADAISTSSASAGFATATPRIEKRMRRPGGAWSDEVTATVGDQLEVRVRFNTTDGATPDRSNIIMGNTTVTDWLPAGTSFNNDAVVTSSGAGDFSDPEPAVAPALNIVSPSVTTIGGMSGVEWYLGNVARGGWWQAVFTVTVVDSAAVSDATTVSNLWKLTGINSFGRAYSDRDACEIEFKEPMLGISKSVSAPTPTVGGSDVTYTVTARNTGTATARDVVVTDTLPVGMRGTAPAITSVTHSRLGALAAGSGYALAPAYNPATGAFTVDLYDAGAGISSPLEPGDTVTVVYKTKVDNGVAAGTTLTNSASVTASSQDGSGRTYSAGPATTNVNVAGVTTQKSGTPNPITFGDVVSYTVTATVPARTVAYWPRIDDTINRDGFSYITGSASLADVSGSPVTSAAFATAADPTVGGTGSNTTLRWLLANYIDNSGSDTPYVFRLKFDVRATGLEDNGSWEMAPPTTTDTVRNTASVYWNTTNPGTRPATPNRTGTSNNADIGVRQPLIRTTKTVAGGPFYGTAVADYTVTMQNTGSSTAYDLYFDDLLPSQVDSATLESIVHPTLGTLTPAHYAETFGVLPLVTVDFDPSVTLAAGQTMTLKYKARVTPGVGSGSSLTNRADADWASRPEGVTGRRVYNDASQESAYTLDTSTVTIASPDPVITKSLASAITTVTVGDEFDYRIHVDVPYNTTLYDGRISDMVPAGLSVESVTTSPSVGSVAVGAATASGTPVVWTLGDISDPPTASLDATVHVRVADVTAGVRPDGLPAGIDGDAQDTYTNTATLEWDTALVGTPRTLTSVPTPAVTVVEPHITAAKSATFTPAGTPEAGATIHWSSTVGNDGTATAHDLVWSDALPSLVETPTLVAVELDGAPLAPSDYTADFSNATSATVIFHRPLPVGSTFRVRYDTVVDADAHHGQTITNAVKVSGASTQPGAPAHERTYPDVPATRSVSVVSPALVVAKSDPADTTLQRGQTAAFTVTVRNVGDGPARSVNVTDTLPAGCSYVAGSAVASWPGHAAAAFEPEDPAAQQLEWDFDATIGAGQTLTLTYSILVGATAPDGPLVNTARAQGETGSGLPIPANATWFATDTDADDTDTGAFSVTNPDVSTLKIRAVAQDEFVQVGEAVRFEIGVTNTGDTALASIPVIDDFDPSVLSFVSATPAPSATAPAGTLTWTDLTGAGSLAPGATTTITAEFTALAASGVTTNSVGVTGTDVNGDAAGTAVSAADVTVTRPSVAVTKTRVSSDAHLQVGESATFQIVATNNGTTPLSAVPLSDTFDNGILLCTASDGGSVGAGTIDWADVGPLAVGESATRTVTFMAIAHPATSSTVDTATVAGATDVHNDAAPTVMSAASVGVTAPAVGVTKSLASGQDAHVQVGDQVTYTIEFENTGDTAIAILPFTDTWNAAELDFDSATIVPTTNGSGTASWVDVTGAGTLDVGDTLSVDVTFEVLSQPADGLVNNLATTGSPTDINGDPVVGGSDDADVAVTRPGVTIDKHAAPGQDAHVQPGESVTFEIVVTNSGDTTLTTVPLEDEFDSAVLGFASSAPAAISPVPGTLSWANVGPLAPGANATIAVEFTALAAPAGHVTTNVARVENATDQWGDSPADVDDSATQNVTDPAVSVSKALAEGQDPIVQVGQPVSFDISVTNSGDTTLTSIPISDAFDPLYLSFVSASDGGVVLGSQVLWTLATSLAPSATTTVTAQFTAVAVPAGNSTEDTATVTGATDLFGDTAPTDDAPSSVAITTPGLNIVKSLAAGHDTHVQAGETVSYVLTIENSGDTAIDTLPLTDTFDEDLLTFVSASVTPDSIAAGALEWDDLGPLAVGATTQVLVVFTATEDAEGLDVDNVGATHDVSDENGDPVASDESTATLAVTRPGVEIDKRLAASQDTTIQVGEQVVFDITVTNTGTTRIEDLALTDVFDEDILQFVSASTAPDSVGAGTLGWLDVGPIDAGDDRVISVTFEAIEVPASGRYTTNLAQTGEGTDEYGDAAPGVSDDADIAITDPNVRVEKRPADGQDAHVQVGESVTYTIHVQNDGDTTLLDVPVSDTFDPAVLEYQSANPAPASQSASALAWDVGPLVPGGEAWIDVTFEVISQPDPSFAVNEAAIAGATDEFGDEAEDVDDVAQIEITRPELSVDKTHLGDHFVALGDTTSYRVSVTNSGDTTAATVPLTDVFDATRLEFVASEPLADTTTANSVSFGDLTAGGELGVGASVEATLTFRVIAPGHVSNLATVAGGTDTNDDPIPGVDDTDDTLLATAPEVSVDKTLLRPESGNVAMGGTATYRLRVTNSGDTTLAVVPLTDVYEHSTLDFVSAAPSADSAGTGSLSWNDITGAGSLAPGAHVDVLVTFAATAPDLSAVNRATVEGAVDVNDDEADPASDEDSTLSVFAAGDLSVTKTADPPSGTIVLPGDTITYSLGYRNAGDVPIAGVVVTDTVTAAAIYNAGSLSHNGALLTDAEDGDAGSYADASRTVRIALGTLAPHSSGEATFTVTVGDLEASRHGVLNSATVMQTGGPSAVSSETVHPVDPFDIIKSVRDVNGGSLRIGDQLEWTITVVNTGLTPTTHVVVRDTVPEETAYVAASITGRGADDSADPDLVWDVGTLAIGESVELTFRSTVRRGLGNGTIIENQASVTADQSAEKFSDDPATTEDDDPTMTEVYVPNTPLARTGADERWLLALAIASVIAGAWLVLSSRRQRSAGRRSARPQGGGTNA